MNKPTLEQYENTIKVYIKYRQLFKKKINHNIDLRDAAIEMNRDMLINDDALEKILDHYRKERDDFDKYWNVLDKEIGIVDYRKELDYPNTKDPFFDMYGDEEPDHTTEEEKELLKKAIEIASVEIRWQE